MYTKNQVSVVNDDFILQLLKYGASDLAIGNNGLTYNELKSKMQDIGFKVDTLEEHQKIWQVIRDAFIYPEGIGGNKKYYFSLDSYFSLLDYLEHEEIDIY